jgi:hypothetical protein
MYTHLPTHNPSKLNWGNIFLARALSSANLSASSHRPIFSATSAALEVTL